MYLQRKEWDSGVMEFNITLSRTETWAFFESSRLPNLSITQKVHESRKFDCGNRITVESRMLGEEDKKLSITPFYAINDLRCNFF